MKHLKKINENTSMSYRNPRSTFGPIFREVKGYEVEASDLAGFIEEKYGKSPEIEASLQMGHDDTCEIFADSGDYGSEEDEIFYQWLENPEHSYSEISAIMNKLAYEGHIESTTYYIKTY